MQVKTATGFSALPRQCPFHPVCARSPIVMARVALATSAPRRAVTIAERAQTGENGHQREDLELTKSPYQPSVQVNCRTRQIAPPPHGLRSNQLVILVSTPA